MSAPPGFRVRPPRAFQVMAVAELIQAAELAEESEAEAESDVAADRDLIDAKQDAWLVEAPGRQLAGYGFVRRHRAGRRVVGAIG